MGHPPRQPPHCSWRAAHAGQSESQTKQAPCWVPAASGGLATSRCSSLCAELIELITQNRMIPYLPIVRPDWSQHPAIGKTMQKLANSLISRSMR